MSNAKYDVNYVEGLAPLPDINARSVSYDEEVQKVGISNLAMPIKWLDLEGKEVKMKGIFSSYVSIEAGSGKKGINMSRIPFAIRERSHGENYGLQGLKDMAKEVATKSGATNSYVKVKFDYPMVQQSLRSRDEEGNPFWAYKYYPVTVEVKYSEKNNNYKAYVTLQFEYSSACVCSTELTEHLLTEENLRGIPHSQRSEARTTVEVDLEKDFSLEKLIALHRKALVTETQILVKRLDEREFACINGKDMLQTRGRNTLDLEEVHPIHQEQGGLKFVEDAARLMRWVLSEEESLKDWVCSLAHHESLHSFSAVSVVYKGTSGGLR